MTDYNYRSLRFLIVDNIKPSQDILKQYVMRKTNKQVDSTHYAQDVASICQQKTYDVILLGYDLGENQKNGQQILEELRVNRYINRHCIVILITAEVSQSMVLAALEHKPDHYLCKPYTLSELDKRLNYCLHKKKSMERIYQALDDDNPLLVIERCKYALHNNTKYKTECLGIISRQYFELQRYDEAKSIYLSHKNSANCQWAMIGLGKLALHEKKLKQAEKLFKLLIKDYPLYLSSYDWLAVTYEEQFHYLFAEEILEQALKLSPRSLSRLKKFANLCIHNQHFDKATFAYEKNYTLAHNSIHHCADNTVKYVQALVEHTPSLPLVDAKKFNNKAFTFIKQMTRDFQDVDIKIQSHLLNACLFEVTREKELANEELQRGELLLIKEQENIAIEKLIEISYTLKKLDKNNLAIQIIEAREKSIAEEKESKHAGVVNFKDKVQVDIELGLVLYSEKKYQDAIKKLESALSCYPQHIGITLNLIQVLLVSYIEGESNGVELERARVLLDKLNNMSLSHMEFERLKKMQKKYQQIAGI
jgi:DNA-binding response OmpR family regulator/Tfp pilus assembly protein PilF